MKENRLARINELLNNRQPDLTVFMDQVHKPHNLAAVVRTADAIGIGEVHAVRAEGAIHRCSGTAMGSDRWVTTHRYETFKEGIEVVKKQGMQVLAAHLSDKAVDFRSIDYTKPTCILLGAEKEGVTDEAANAADQHIIIPMLGMVQSLNVSVANSIILYEAQRQREAAGMYGTRKISDEVYERLVFEWLHPKIKRFCQKHKIRYPQLNEEGDIDDDAWQELRRNI
ncbi:tRNA (guanosine(18)-2'-O)-methyltransferase TrmH [Pleionea sediminis]|uniref:tRNA (guanosine(18)-2'-O)-methyltransferase TrmH n=1 Tax=Pleionea sediminis TaxID=2569479 RepID=UPI0011850487|nr:tRNA (guanosine(18)-2'-O)-methyltransferase TrmH [Pleionea sediminis]